MKCLSVCQPFAELIISKKKTIELRSWNTKFRGEFLIHSPTKIKIKDCQRLKINKKLITGAIVGKAEIIDVKIYRTKTEIRSDLKKHFASIERNGPTYGFILKNAKKFNIPIPYKGRLGFFDVELPKSKIRKNSLKADIIDEEYRYQWIGRH
jgi:hypothetical protein